MCLICEADGNADRSAINGLGITGLVQSVGRPPGLKTRQYGDKPQMHL
jgi:hypothetical protein